MENLTYKEPPRFEMLDGKIVCMSPRPAINHSIVSDNIFNIFKNFLKGKPCKTFSDGVEIHLNKKDIFIPDVVVVCNRSIIKEYAIHGAPDLVIEVLSPSTAKNDRGYKKKSYQKSGIKEYWIVDTTNRSIEVYLLKNNDYVLDNVYTIFPDSLIEKMTEDEKVEIATEFKTSLFPDLTISLEDVFEGML